MAAKLSVVFRPPFPARSSRFPNPPLCLQRCSARRSSAGGEPEPSTPPILKLAVGGATELLRFFSSKKRRSVSSFLFLLYSLEFSYLIHCGFIERINPSEEFLRLVALMMFCGSFDLTSIVLIFSPVIVLFFLCWYLFNRMIFLEERVFLPSLFLWLYDWGSFLRNSKCVVVVWTKFFQVEMRNGMELFFSFLYLFEIWGLIWLIVNREFYFWCICWRLLVWRSNYQISWWESICPLDHGVLSNFHNWTFTNILYQSAFLLLLGPNLCFFFPGYLNLSK